jgi:3-keto-5-aminohexanoate cleavage enzyme
MPELPVIIEAALNGATPKSRNPNVPRTPAEIAEDALRCIDAGASIVHNHNDDPVIGGSGVHAWEPYLEAWRLVLRERPGAVLYTTMAGGGPHVSVEQRYSHVEKLAAEGVLGLGLVDPGSVDFGGMDSDGLPSAVDIVYQNTYRDIRYMFTTCQRLGLGTSISIFEPGFLRVVMAYHRAGRLPPSMVKVYFGAASRGIGFGLPPTEKSLDAYLAMMEGAPISWLVSAIGGDVVGCGIAEVAMRRGGHVQVGLEPYGGEGTPTNADLVRRAVALAEKVGRPVASVAEARRIIGIAPPP